MARGDRREEIFRDDRGRGKFLGYLAEGAERYRVKVHCYVLMENQFHLVATTPEGNLSKWMHQLLFQGRFKSTVIEAEKYLLEVSRYLHLNPVASINESSMPSRRKPVQPTSRSLNRSAVPNGAVGRSRRVAISASYRPAVVSSLSSAIAGRSSPAPLALARDRSKCLAPTHG
jgi:hypothetical protein